jgi:hypothetical protein
MQILTQRHRGTENQLFAFLRASVPLCEIVLLIGAFAGRNAVADEKADRLGRSPQQVAEQLAKVYGHKLDQVAYIPALPLVVKVRLSGLTGDVSHASEVAQIVEPYLSGQKTPVPKSGSEQAGHLIFAEMAEHSRAI